MEQHLEQLTSLLVWYNPSYCIAVSAQCYYYYTGILSIPTAALPPPTNLRATATATSITLTWEQPEEANAVEKYEINYL